MGVTAGLKAVEKNISVLVGEGSPIVQSPAVSAIHIHPVWLMDKYVTNFHNDV